MNRKYGGVARAQSVTGDAIGELTALPLDWKYESVGALGKPYEQPVLTGPFGTNLGRSDFIDRGVPVLTIGCLTEGGITLDKALYVSEKKAQELKRYRLREGDLLFSRMASVGRAGLVPAPLAGALFNYHIMRLRLDESRIDPRVFINYVRGARQVRDYLKAVNHGATRDGINTEQLLGLPVAVPPVGKQREIVAEIEKQFSRLDEAVANLKRVKSNLKRYKAAVLKAAVEGRLVATEAELARREGSGYESASQLLGRVLESRRSQVKGRYKEPITPDTGSLPALPEGWLWASAEQCCASVRDGTHDTPAYVSSGIPLVTSKNLLDSGIDFDNTKHISESLKFRHSRSPDDAECIAVARRICSKNAQST
jgi:type I restriction enzyme S subunit